MPSSERAMMRVTAEMDRFNQRLVKLTAAYLLDLAEVVKWAVVELRDRIKAPPHPVRTGRSRASWHAVVWGGPTTYHYTDDFGKAYDGTLQNPHLRGPYDALVGSNVAYIPRLEAGWSQQAPNGWIRVAVEELRREMEQKLREAPKRVKG